MKVITKTGDKGTTSIAGGERVSKTNSKVEACGTIDELIAYIGLLRDQKEIDENEKRFLTIIQSNLMQCCFLVSSKDSPNLLFPEESLIKLEEEANRIGSLIPEPQGFVLPGGHPVISIVHVCRTITRRAERNCVKVMEEYGIAENVIKYINRLSDYMYLYSKLLHKLLNIKEIYWNFSTQK
jgi:cob(I)alamin adenosyltransferase